MDFTLSPKFAGFPDLITRMHADGMRVILILVSPYVNGWSLFRRVSGLWWRKLCIVFPSML